MVQHSNQTEINVNQESNNNNNNNNNGLLDSLPVVDFETQRNSYTLKREKIDVATEPMFVNKDYIESSQKSIRKDKFGSDEKHLSLLQQPYKENETQTSPDKLKLDGSLLKGRSLLLNSPPQ